jgi:hypothetical protein
MFKDKFYGMNIHTEEDLKEKRREIVELTQKEFLQVRSNQFKKYIECVCRNTIFRTSHNVGKLSLLFDITIFESSEGPYSYWR